MSCILRRGRHHESPEVRQCQAYCVWCRFARRGEVLPGCCGRMLAWSDNESGSRKRCNLGPCRVAHGGNEAGRRRVCTLYGHLVRLDTAIQIAPVMLLANKQCCAVRARARKGQTKPSSVRVQMAGNTQTSSGPLMPKERVELLDRAWSEAADLYLK